MRSGIIHFHRYISWVLALVSVVTIVGGYALARGWFPSLYLQLSLLHRMFEVSFIALLILHVSITLRYYKLNLRETWSKKMQRDTSSIHLMRFTQRVSSWLIVIGAVITILTGLNGYPVYANAFGDVIPFAPHRVADLLLISAIIIHVTIGIRFAMMRRRVRRSIANRGTVLLLTSLILVTLFLNPLDFGVITDDNTNTVYVPPQGYIQIAGDNIPFRPQDVETVRPDIFRPGSFSMFDVLVHVSNQGLVNLEYHFNSSMNTYVIDMLNGSPFWWYRVIYSGGWYENNVFRMDHYPWKNGTSLTFYKERETRLQLIYETYVADVQRFQANGAITIVPEISINGVGFSERFYDITVTPHNLRNDTFQNDVITAIDVMLSLGDQDLISYKLQWYNAISTARVVNNYWIDGINGENTSGTCGWVYDTGSLEFYGFGGNHIHLPSDARAINSPEYMRWFWICV